MTLVPNETEQALNRQHDVYAAAREEYRKKIAEQAAEIERLKDNRSEQILELKYHIDQQYAEIVRFQSQVKKLKSALRRLTCNCSEEQHRAECEADCPYWSARAALEGK